MSKPPRSKYQNNTMVTHEDMNNNNFGNNSGTIDDKKKFLSYFSNKIKSKNGDEIANSRNGASGNFLNANSAYGDGGKAGEFFGTESLAPNRNPYKSNANPVGSNRMQINNYKIP
jgi:hypothetical protein